MKLYHRFVTKPVIVLSLVLVLSIMAGSVSLASASTTYKFINGVVTNTEGEPLAGIQVDFWRNDPYDPWNPDLWWHLATMTTGPDGSYLFAVPTIYDGFYRLYFSDPTDTYIPEYYDDKGTFGEADIIWPVTYMKPENARNAVLDRVVVPPTPGSITGIVTGPEGPVSSTFVTAYSFNGVFWGLLGSSLTAPDGSYTIPGLFAGAYRVFFWPPLETGLSPEFFDNVKGTIEEATDIAVAEGTNTPDVNAELEFPPPPVGDADSDSGSTNVDPLTGQIVVTMPVNEPSDLAVTATPTCPEGSTVGDVVLVLTDAFGNATQWPMSETPPGSGLYMVVVPAASLPTFATMTIDYTCNGIVQPPVPLGQIILYDPSGFVTDAITQQPIANATVTLFTVPGWTAKVGPDDNSPNTCESNLSRDHDGDGNPDPDDPWDQPAPVDVGVVAIPVESNFTPAVNPLLTGADGHYGWAVSVGCWYVTVAMDGYRPLTSPVVGVPPEVTDLDMSLTPVGLVYIPIIHR